MNKSLALIALISTIVIVVTAKPQHHKRQHQESHNHKNHHEAIVSKINNGNNLWKAAINEITEKGEEYVISLLGAKLPKNPSDLDLPLKPKEKIITKYASDPSVIPKSFDARKKWRKCDSVSSIKNQGNCGSCWAVAATSAASDRLCIKTDGNIKLNISAENLMACCEDCVDPGTKGCDGGYSNKAWMYIKNTGIVTGGDYLSEEGCQPYEIPPQSSKGEAVTPDCRRICTNTYYNIPFRRDRHFADSIYLYSDNAVIQYDIMTDGPVEAGFIVYDDFPYYKSGVYHRTSTKQLGGHAVRIIGWGNENGEDYWLVANSWGRKWGANGTFKIRRGTNECMFESFVVAGIVSE